MSAAYEEVWRSVLHGLKDMGRSPFLFFGKCGGLHNGCTSSFQPKSDKSVAWHEFRGTDRR